MSEHAVGNKIRVFLFTLSFFICDRALTAISKRLYRPWFQIEWIWKLTKYVERLSKYQRFSNDILDNVITETGSFYIHKYIQGGAHRLSNF